MICDRWRYWRQLSVSDVWNELKCKCFWFILTFWSHDSDIIVTGFFVCNCSAFLHSVVTVLFVLYLYWFLNSTTPLAQISTCKRIIFSHYGRQGGLVKMWKVVKNAAFQKPLGPRNPEAALSCAYFFCKGGIKLFLLICVMRFLGKNICFVN